MLFFSESNKRPYFESLMEEQDHFPVSLSAPFLSNLLIIDNIKLAVEAAGKVSDTAIHDKAKELLRCVGLEESAYKHYTALDDKEYFFAQLVRSAMIEDAKIIIDRPFSMVSGQSDLNFIFDALEALNLEFDRVTVLELFSSEDYFMEDRCKIEKWQ